jgi:hypothetical protein
MGTGTVGLTIAANGGAPRSGAVTIAGLTFTVTQAAPACAYAISPGSAALAAGGGSVSIAVATASWCSWTAASSDPTWLTVTSGPSGSGNGTVVIAASVNSGTNRAANVTIGDQVFTVTQTASSMPAGWAHQDVGAVAQAGDATFDGTTFTVTGGGADVWGTADAMQFAFRTLDGDGSVVARIASIQNVNSWTKAGVMIRESLDPSAANAYMLVSRANGVAFQRRTVAAGTTSSTAGASSTAPYWVRLDRAGNTVTARRHAADGNHCVCRPRGVQPRRHHAGDRDAGQRNRHSRYADIADAVDAPRHRRRRGRRQCDVQHDDIHVHRQRGRRGYLGQRRRVPLPVPADERRRRDRRAGRDRVEYECVGEGGRDDS